MNKTKMEPLPSGKETESIPPVTTPPMKTRFHPHEVTWLGLFALPPLFLLFVLGWGMAKEIRDGNRMQRLIVNRSADWPQFRAGALTQVFDERTSKENTEIWHAVFNTRDRLIDDTDQIVEGFSTLTPPGKPWPAEPYATRKVRESEWIDHYRDQLEPTDKPMWTPARIEGDFNWWPLLRDASELLDRDANAFRGAYHNNDHDRTRKLLSNMNQTLSAIDWWWVPSANFRWGDHQQKITRLIRDSVQFPFWSDDELRELRSSLTKTWRMEERFEQTVQYTLASRLQTAKRIGLDDRQEWQARDLRRLLPFGISDTHLWDLIDSQQRVLQVPGAGTWKHARTVRKIESRLIGGAGSESSVSLVSIPFARSSTTLAPIHHGAFQVARHLAETETYRRWTLTAVGVRQYRNQFEQWPEGLRQLSRVGLTANDWEFEPGKPFGNHVSKDGTEFRLWIPDIDDYLSNPNVHRLEVDNRYLPTELNSSRTIDEDRIVRLKLD